MNSKEKIGIYSIKIKKSLTGKGLFAQEDIPKGKYVIEYFGRELSEKEKYTSNSKYLFEINSKKTIDGNVKPNIARYINHSCVPNCEVEIKKGRILVFSKKNIKRGEELSYNYGREYWNEILRPMGCKCPKCFKKAS